MAFKTYLLIGGLSFFYSGASYAQLRIPIFDAELKINQNLIFGGGDDNGTLIYAETTNLFAGVHVQLNQHIALGFFIQEALEVKHDWGLVTAAWILKGK